VYYLAHSALKHEMKLLSKTFWNTDISDSAGFDTHIKYMSFGIP